MKKLSIALLSAFLAVAAEAVTVTLKANDGTGASQTITSGALPTPTRAGYHFVGWFPDETTSRVDFTGNAATTSYVQGTLLCGTPVTNATDLAADATLYAKWVPQAVYDHFRGKTVVVLGDSISTYTGEGIYRPITNDIYYRLNGTVFYPYRDDVTGELRPLDVEQHWWGQIVQALDMRVLTINAIGGSTVLCNLKEMENPTNGQILPRGMVTSRRIGDIGARGTPDVIIVAAGVNDCLLFDIDEFDPDGAYLTNELDTKNWYITSFAEGYATMLRRIQASYPDAEIITLSPFYLNTGNTSIYPKVDRTDDIIESTSHFLGIANIDMRKAWSTNDTTGIQYQAQNVHPYIAGLTAMANCFFENWQAPCLHAHCATNAGTAATCTAPGTSKTITCSDCGTVIAHAHAIPALGHLWDAGTITTAPTETTPGVRTYACTRGCGATKTQSAPYAGDIVAMRNVAAVTAVGTQPTLPATVVGLRADGSSGASFPAVWEAADVSRGGTVEVNGTADGMPVKAFVRVVPTGADATPIDLTAEAYERNVYFPNGTALPATWTRYFQSNPASDDPVSMIFDRDYGTYFLDYIGARHSVGLKFRNDVVVTTAMLRTETNYSPQGQPITLETGDGTVLDSKTGPFPWDGKGNQVDFTAGSAVPTKEVHIVVPDYWGGFLAAEVTVQGYYAPGAPAAASNADLADLLLDGSSVPGFAPDQLLYEQNGSTVSAAVDGNVALTVLPAFNDVARIVTLSEDGTQSRIYAVDLGHEIGNWVISAMPTETTPGTKIRRCVHAGCQYFEEEPIAYSDLVFHTVTLNPMGGTMSEPTTMTFAPEFETFDLPVPTKEGYHFVGWFADETFHHGKLLVGTNYREIPNGTSTDLTLYAKWVKDGFYNHFAHRTAAVLGDSVSTFHKYPFSATNPGAHYTEAVCTPNGITEETTWWGQVIQACDMTHQVHNAISGTQLVAIDGDDAVYANSAMMNDSRLEKFDSADPPDVLFVFGGINDYFRHKDSGVIDDFDPHAVYLTNELDRTSTTVPSYAEGIALLIRRLRDRLPTTEIVMMTPYYSAYYSDELCDQAAATVADVCQYFGIVCLDLSKSLFHIGRAIPEYSGNNQGVALLVDSIHPNNTGFHCMADYLMENWQPFCSHADVTTNGTYVAATCLAPGHMPVRHCNLCGIDLPAYDIPALGHLYDAWTTNAVPDCITNGSRTHTCTRTDCDASTEGHSVTETIPALGHLMGEWQVTKAATTTEPGSKTRSCTRDGCIYSETVEIPMIPLLAAIRNVAVATTEGTPPSLPAEAAGLLPDGTTAGSYPVAWDTTGVSFATAGIVSVPGTVTVEGLDPFTVSASVRVVADSGELTNFNTVATSHSAVPNDRNPSLLLNLSAPSPEDNIWWDLIAAAGWPNTVTLSVGWDEPVPVRKVVVYFMYDGGNITIPANVAFYSGDAVTGTPIDFTQDPFDSNPAIWNSRARISYTFHDTQPLTKLTFVADSGIHDKGIDIMRMWACAPLGGAAALAADELDTLAVDGKSIALTSAVYGYTAEDASAITIATAKANMGITILPKNPETGCAYVVTLSEDGLHGQRYVVDMHASCEHQWSAWTVTLDPTAYEPGQRSRTCPLCSRTQTEAIPALGRTTNEWFKVEFANYTSAFSSYATDPVDGGTWTRGANDASEFTTDGDSNPVVALVSTNGVLQYAPTSPSASGNDVEVRTQMRFDFPNLSDPPSLPGSQVAICVFPAGKKTYCYKAWDGTDWIPLEGAVPTAGFVDVRAQLRYIVDGNHPKAVRFSVDGTVLHDGKGAEWLPIATPKTCVTSVGFTGTADLGDFRGWYVAVEGEGEDDLPKPRIDSKTGIYVGERPLPGIGTVDVFELQIVNPDPKGHYTVLATDNLLNEPHPVSVVQSDAGTPSVSGSKAAGGVLTLTIPLSDPMPDSLFVKVVVSSTNYVASPVH